MYFNGLPKGSYEIWFDYANSEEPIPFNKREHKDESIRQIKKILTGFFAQKDLSERKWRLYKEKQIIQVTDALMRTTTPQVKEPLQHFKNCIEEKKFTPYSDENLSTLLEMHFDRYITAIPKKRDSFVLAMAKHLKENGYTGSDALKEAKKIKKETKL